MRQDFIIVAIDITSTESWSLCLNFQVGCIITTTGFLIWASHLSLKSRLLQFRTFNYIQPYIIFFNSSIQLGSGNVTLDQRINFSSDCLLGCEDAFFILNRLFVGSPAFFGLFTTFGTNSSMNQSLKSAESIQGLFWLVDNKGQLFFWISFSLANFLVPINGRLGLLEKLLQADMNTRFLLLLYRGATDSVFGGKNFQSTII